MASDIDKEALSSEPHGEQHQVPEDAENKPPLDELKRRSRISLEWPELCSALAGMAVFSENRKKLGQLGTEECETAELRSKMFTLTEEMLRVLSSGLGYFQFHDLELAEAIASLRLGRTLSPTELLNIRKLLELSLKAKAFVAGRDHNDRRRSYPQISEELSTLNPDPKLAEKLGRSVDDEAHILSTASPELAAARASLAAAERRLVGDLERLLKSNSIRDALQDPVWMERDGHYVLPVRTDRKSAVEGTTISVSQSGSTLFIEPAGLAQARAALESAKRDEHVALNRVLRELSHDCRQQLEDVTECAAILLAMDRLVARARLAKQLGAVRPELHTDKRRPFITLEGARHPLFLLEGKPCIPNRFGFGAGSGTGSSSGSGAGTGTGKGPESRDKVTEKPPCVLVLSGPNAGGKTVSMKTFGIFVLMAKSGLFVPADRAAIFDFDSVYAAIGDSQNRQEDLSTFSAHLQVLMEIMQRATPNALILLDEGFVGTDPAMGAALARAVLESLAERRICTVITTHFSQLKTISDENPAFINASMEFEQSDIRPTYRLLEGIPGQSYALELASRMGFPNELLNRAKTLHGKEAGRMERLLQELQIARNQADHERRQQEQIRTELESMQKSLAQDTASLQAMRADLAAQYEDKLQRRLNAFRNALEIRERQFERRKERLIQDIEQQQRIIRVAETSVTEHDSNEAKKASDPKENPGRTTAAKTNPLKEDLTRQNPLKDFAALAKLAEQRGFTAVNQRSKANNKDKSPSAKDRKWLQGSKWNTGDVDEILELEDDDHDNSSKLLSAAQRAFANMSQEFKDLESEFSDDLDAALELAGFVRSDQNQGHSNSKHSEGNRAGGSKNILSKNDPQTKQTPTISEAEARKLFVPGAKVKSSQFKETGEIREPLGSKGLVLCQFGAIKTKLHFSALTLVRPAPGKSSAQSQTFASSSRSHRKPTNNLQNKGSGKAILDIMLPPINVFPSRTIDLRGCEVDVALDRLDRFIDRVYREEMSSFVILHGHGMGAVKTAIRNWLKTFDTPSRYRPGTAGEGGDGVTIVVLD
jgi:DNA mismatch repair protein MutS2